MRRLVFVVALAACEPDVELATTETAIVAGVPAPDDHAVVALVRRSVACQPEITGVECTATVIAPRVIVTAAHCVGGAPANALEVVFGPDLWTSTTRIPIVGGRAHPEWNPETHANDIAVLILGATAPIAPIAVNRTALPDLTGTDVRLVGYGITSGTASDIGTRRAGIARISETGADELRMVPGPGMSCRGDSGGPVLGASGELIGVTSYGDPACRQFGVALRVDRQAALLQEVLDEAMASPMRLAFDPDEAFCQRTCVSDADCPAETMCFGLPDQPRRCVYRGLPAGELGDSCKSNGECSCVAMPNGDCREFRPCVVEEGETCRADEPGCGCSAARGGGSFALLLLATLVTVAGGRARRTD